MGVDHCRDMLVDAGQQLLHDVVAVGRRQTVQRRDRQPGVKADGPLEPALGAGGVRPCLGQAGLDHQRQPVAPLHLQLQIGVMGQARAGAGR